MKDLLATYYAIQIGNEEIIDGKLGYKSDEYIYFTTRAVNNTAIHMEQATLSYYLVENGYHQAICPVPNATGEWITSYNGEKYLVLKAKDSQRNALDPHGKMLAQFHQANASYYYEPQYISSYGQWGALWIDKSTGFENKIIEESKKESNDYYRLLMDVLPYIIGISENAIQYMRESELEYRYDLHDQGTIVFQRYNDNLLKDFIWPNDLVYDHPTRDIAELIRTKLLNGGKDVLEELGQFLRDYESVHPLSVFSWRLLYARLIFPVHIFDLIESGFLTMDYERKFTEMTILLERHSDYEENIGHLFQLAELNHVGLTIPMLHWL